MRKAFSFIEIMVVISIIIFIFAIAMLPFMKAKKNSQKEICIQNMKLLESTIIGYRNSNHVFPLPPNVQYLGRFKEQFAPFIKGGKFPMCPSGGYYYLRNDSVYCSEHGNWIGEKVIESHSSSEDSTEVEIDER